MLVSCGGIIKLNSSSDLLFPGEEWALVPSNAGGMGLPAFYVMKYEARAKAISDGSIDPNGTGVNLLDNKPVSISDNQPWRNINALDAYTACTSLGDKYDLISNQEWMAIARDAETQGANWTGGSVGSGCFYRGNSAETTVGDGTNLGDSCGYDAVPEPDFGSARDRRARHVLSNGQEVYDMAGNVKEIVDWDRDTAGFQVGGLTANCFPNELSVASCTGLVDADFNTANGSYTRTQGVGYFGNGAVGNVTLRGNYWYNTVSTGIFYIDFVYNMTTTDNGIGFRCVYRP